MDKSEHVHQCQKCKPDMVPDFDVDDPKYHASNKCQTTFQVLVNGQPSGYTIGAFEGNEGWALIVSPNALYEEVHECPSCSIYGHIQGDGFRDIVEYAYCTTPVFGKVEVVHDCPKFAYRGNITIQ